MTTKASKTTKTTPVYARIDNDILPFLDEYAAQKRISRSLAINEMVKQSLAIYEFSRLQSRKIVTTPAQSSIVGG